MIEPSLTLQPKIPLLNNASSPSSLESFFDSYAGDRSPLSLNPSPREAAFSDWQPKQLESLLVEPEDGQREDDSNPFHHTTRLDPLLGSTQNSALVKSDSLTVLESLSDRNSLVSLGKFGDYDGQEDATLTLKDANGNSAETFSLTGKGYAEVLKDGKYEYVIFSGTDQTTSVQISARDDLKFNDYIGSSLQVQTQGSITTNNILSNGGTINLVSTWESVTSRGHIATNGGRVKIAGVEVDVVKSSIEAAEVTLFANHNLNLEESQLRATGDLNLLAQNRVQVRDSATHPFVAKAGGQLKLQGNQSIEIMSLNHPQTSFESGGDLSL